MRIHWSYGKNAIHGQFICESIPETCRTPSFDTKKKKEIKEVFPKGGIQETYPYDKVEQWLIDYPLQTLKGFFNRFTFLQNGNLQFYILYGVIFISLVLGVPFLAEYIKSLIGFLNKL